MKGFSILQLGGLAIGGLLLLSNTNTIVSAIGNPELNKLITTLTTSVSLPLWMLIIAAILVSKWF